jgi:hypothetical protein
MPTDISHLACPACMEQVFSGYEAYLCDRCDRYQHKRCWNEAGRCTASDRCRGKPREVVVVRLEASGPTAEVIAETVERRLGESLTGPLEELGRQLAKQRDMERVKNALRNIHDAIGAADSRVEDLRAALDAGLRDLRRTLDDMGDKTHVAEVVPASGVSDEELSRIVRETSERMDASAERLRETLAGLLSGLSSDVRSELYRVQQAVDACRWDTGARRHPLPWDERSEGVFLPTPEEPAGESS